MHVSSNGGQSLLPTPRPYSGEDNSSVESAVTCCPCLGTEAPGTALWPNTGLMYTPYYGCYHRSSILQCQCLRVSLSLCPQSGDRMSSQGLGRMNSEKFFVCTLHHVGAWQINIQCLISVSTCAWGREWEIGDGERERAGGTKVSRPRNHSLATSKTNK